MRTAFTVVAGAAVLGLSGCYHRVNDVSFDFARNQIIASADSIDGSDEDAREAQDKLKACGFEIKPRGADGTKAFEIITDFASPAEANSRLRCAYDDWQHVKVLAYDDDSFFWESQKVEISMRRPVLLETLSQSTPNIPNELSIVLPEEVSSCDYSGNAVGLDFACSKRGTVASFSMEWLNEGLVRNAHFQDLMDQIEAQHAGKDLSEEEMRQAILQAGDEEFSFTIVSGRFLIGIEEVLSVLGLLFGSGIVWRLGAQSARKADQKKSKEPT